MQYALSLSQVYICMISLFSLLQNPRQAVRLLPERFPRRGAELQDLQAAGKRGGGRVGLRKQL